MGQPLAGPRALVLAVLAVLLLVVVVGAVTSARPGAARRPEGEAFAGAGIVGWPTLSVGGSAEFPPPRGGAAADFTAPTCRGGVSTEAGTRGRGYSPYY